MAVWDLLPEMIKSAVKLQVEVPTADPTEILVCAAVTYAGGTLR